MKTDQINGKASVSSKIWLGFVFAWFLIISSCIPYFADDLANFARVGSDAGFGVVWRQAMDVYQGWSGRFVSSYLLLGMLTLGKVTSAFCNAVFGTLFFYLADKLIKGGSDSSINASRTMTMVFAIFLLSIPSLGEVTFWVTGSVVYYWTFVYCLAFMIPFARFCNTADLGLNSDSAVFGLVMFAGGVAVGLALEHLSLAVLTFTLAALFWGKVCEHRKLPLWAWLGLLGQMIGLVLLFAAPGNYVRNRAFASVNAQPLAERLQNYWTNLLDVEREAKLLWWLLALGAVYTLITLVIKQVSWREWFRAHRLFILLLLASAVANAAMVASPYFPPRAAAPSAFFMVLAVVVLLQLILKRHSEHLNLWANVVFATVSIVMCYKILISYVTLRGENERRESIIAMQRLAGTEDVVVPAFEIKRSRLLFISDISENPNEWTNVAFRNYYGLKSIKIKSIKSAEL